MPGAADSTGAAGPVEAGTALPDDPALDERLPLFEWSVQRGVLALIALVVLVWLVVKGADDPRRFAVVTLNGVTLAALYFVVASGFTLIFGLMRVVNMAHGSLYLLGGYIAFELQKGSFQEESGGLEDLSITSPAGGAGE